MCGLTAFFSYTTIDDSIINKLHLCNDEMWYRGPDEQDVWSDEKVGLAHVRLSIIGVDNGHQPLFNEDKSLVLICNGEIYNYTELKQSLIQKGHQFQTSSDCETILHLYEEYGNSCVNYLKGMFAFVLWDTSKQRLFVARDHAGKKPLYYTQTPSGVAISSELKVLKKYFVVEPSLNFEVLRQTQKYSYSISPSDTYIEQVHKIPSGSYATLDQQKGLRIAKYFHRKISPSFQGSYEDACKKTKQLLYDAVEKRLQSEVPIATLLSAGVDSSAIASIAKELGHEVHVIAAGYKGLHSVDERKDAKRLADEKAFIWHEIELEANDFIDYGKEILPILDEPNGDIAMFAQWGIYKKAKEMGFTVLLSGNGGDELFYGYQPHNEYAQSLEWLEKQKNQFPKPSKIYVWNHLVRLLTSHDWRIGKMINKATYFPVSAELNHNKSTNNILEREDWHRNIDATHLDKVYFFLHYAWLTNNCYFLADKLAMAHSIEVRCPFADQDLISYIDTLPLKLKWPKQWPKQLLKDALQGVLPDYVLKRPKTGFTPPNQFVTEVQNRYQATFFENKPTTFSQLITDTFASEII